MTAPEVAEADNTMHAEGHTSLCDVNDLDLGVDL